jgi:hypothetical protein
MDLFWQINWEEMLSALIGTTFVILLPVSIVVVSSMVMFPLIDVAFRAKPAPKVTRERRTIDNRQSMMPYCIIQPTGMRGEVTELDLLKAERDDKAFADNWRDGRPWLALRSNFLRPGARLVDVDYWLKMRNVEVYRNYDPPRERITPLIDRSLVPKRSEGAPTGPVTAPPTPLTSNQLQPYSGVNTKARKMSKKSAKVAKKVATERLCEGDQTARDAIQVAVRQGREAEASLRRQS